MTRHTPSPSHCHEVNPFTRKGHPLVLSLFDAWRTVCHTAHPSHCHEVNPFTRNGHPLVLPLFDAWRTVCHTAHSSHCHEVSPLTRAPLVLPDTVPVSATVWCMAHSVPSFMASCQ
ncbi:hypothetical protein E2C01_096224 [Portunus trituberculatus]|uniref:Uncharacterized protein n=1 Tax=Portunus trituberculatus TaxID=210409 RepID=A0A5B7JV25_PORTR|nr:hypothetical protein [Portunus trituberculatus]